MLGAYSFYQRFACTHLWELHPQPLCSGKLQSVKSNVPSEKESGEEGGAAAGGVYQ